MDIDGLADHAVTLVNAPLDDVRSARALVRDVLGGGPARRVSDDDVEPLRQAAADLRAIFGARDERRAASRLSTALRRWPVAPVLVRSDDGWVLRPAAVDGGVVAALAGPAAYGLAAVFADRGADHLGVCADPTCGTAFVARNSGRPRQWCSDRCASRAHVAAYRARRRVTT